MTEKLKFVDWILYKNAMLLYDKSNVFNISFDENMATGVGKVNIIRLHDDQVQLIDNNVIAWTEFENCKLILRSIEQLTDEEIKKCHDLSFWDREGQSMEERRILIDVKQERWGCSLSKSERDLTDYLRSIKIDIDNFIKSGKAVKDV